MKASLTRLATIFAAAVFTVSSSPPNVGRGNYVYDSNSIPQNEKILKLFVRLAAHTANRLIQLKLKAHPQIKALESYEDEINVEPEILLGKSGDKIVHPISLKPDEQSRRSVVGTPDGDESQKNPLLPTHDEKSHENVPELPSARSEVNLTSKERSNDPENGVTDRPVNRLLEEQRATETPIENPEVVTNESSRRKLPDEKVRDDDGVPKSHISDEISNRKLPEVGPTKETVIADGESGDIGNKLKYNDDETTRQSEISMEYKESSTVNNFPNQPTHGRYLADEEVELGTDSSIIPFEITTVKSIDAIYSPSPNPRADFSDNVAVTEEPKEGDVELENRALFNMEKNNYVTHYSDQSTNINRADTTVTNGGSGQTGKVIVNQYAGSRPIERLERIEERGKIFSQSGEGQELAAGDVVVNQVAGSSGSQRSTGIDRSVNENQATTMVGNADARNHAATSFGFEKNGVGMNRESMGANGNWANLGQMETSNLRAAAEARAETTGSFTDGVNKIEKSGGDGVATQKELALHVQPKHSLTGSLLGGILSTGSQSEGSANMQAAASSIQDSIKANEENPGSFRSKLNKETQTRGSANMESHNSMENSMKVNGENSGIFHGELNKETQTRGSENMNLGNSMQHSTAIAKDENTRHFGGYLSTGSHSEGSANMEAGHSMQNSMIVNKGNSGIFRPELNTETETRGSANMNLENSMQDATGIIREENASHSGGQLSTGSNIEGSTNMGSHNSVQSSTGISENNAGILQGELNAQMVHRQESKMQESVSKKHEHEIRSYASAHEAHQQGSMSQGNLQIGSEKTANLASGRESGEASSAEKNLRADSSVTTNQGIGLNLGAHIGLNLQHHTNSNPSISKKNGMAIEDIHGSMNGGSNIGVGSATKLEASKEVSVTGSGLLNAKTNLFHKALNPVRKFNGKLNLAAHVLGTS